jgi:hypothetical protein
LGQVWQQEQVIPKAQLSPTKLGALLSPRAVAYAKDGALAQSSKLTVTVPSLGANIQVSAELSFTATLLEATCVKFGSDKNVSMALLET